ncbi:MAG: hypothetical protein JXR64_14040 [Spirochaetales bacterium]|nr:hypothetical protein [Spirochaetales bacterium]
MERKLLFGIILVIVQSIPIFSEIITYESALKDVNNLDKGGRWLCLGIKEINEIDGLDKNTKEVINKHLLSLIENEDLRFDYKLHKAFISDRKKENVIPGVIDILNKTYLRISSPINRHDGYWVTKMRVPNTLMQMTIINDIHIDAAENRVTIYSQSLIAGSILVPPQVQPGEFVLLPDKSLAGSHPNAVYLNGSGKELSKADGTGTWWVKNSWELGGEGYYNWELKPKEEYGEGILYEGVLLEDGLTMRVGPADKDSGFYSLRTPIIKKNSVKYIVTLYGPKNVDPDKGPVDLTPKVINELEFIQKIEKSAFDNLSRKSAIK